MKRWFARKDQVLTMDVPSTDETEDLKTPYFPGMHTIKNINSKTSDDLFYFHAGLNVLPGYVSTSGVLSLNLIDNRKKLVKSLCRSYYHAVLDDLSELAGALAQHPDHDVILDVSNVSDLLEREGSDWGFINHFLSILTDKGIKYKLVKLTDYDVIYMDNFRVAKYPADSEKKVTNIYEFFKSSVKNLDQKPYRNVFVSRKHAHGQNLNDIKDRELRKDGLPFSVDARIDDHEELENVFRNLGYEIVYSEKFDTFQEQIEFFYTVKTLASLTGSGLTNAALMQPGGTVIEIVTPLLVSIPGPGEVTKNLNNLYFVQELHNFYKNIAFYQDHFFFSLQNPDRSIEKLKNDIESNPQVKAFLDRNE
jgi:hypothetical protein